MWSAVYKKLWIVILLPLVAAGIAYLLTNKKAGSYRSVAVVEASIPDQPSAHTLKDIPEPDEYYDNMVGAMKTELITSMVSYRLLLHDLEKEIAFRPPAIQYSDARKESTKKILEKKLASFELLSTSNPAEQTINQVIHNMNYDIGQWIRNGEMSVERKPGTNDIEVATSSEDPFLSAFASNSLSSEYIRYETLIKTPPAANDSIGFYRQEVDRLRKNMEAKTGELNEAQAVKPTASPTNDARYQRARADRIAEYEMRITEEQWELNTLRDRLAKIERPETPQPQQTQADISTNAKIQAIRNKIDQLSGIYAQGGSKDQKLDSIINVLRKQLNDETARLQMTSRPAVAANTNSASNRDREMLESRIRRHEENIASIRNDIRRIKNSTQPTGGGMVNTKLIAQLKDEQSQATSEYNTALVHLKALEAKSGNTTSASRASHHLVLKEKALPSAEPESPWAMFIIISAYFGTLAICLIVIAVTRPTPPPMDDIFLRVNYQSRLNKKSTPVTESGPA
jgi:succinoglycan biosynthesis transport protein ExoP